MNVVYETTKPIDLCICYIKKSGLTKKYPYIFVYDDFCDIHVDTSYPYYKDYEMRIDRYVYFIPLKDVKNILFELDYDEEDHWELFEETARGFDHFKRTIIYLPKFKGKITMNGMILDNRYFSSKYFNNPGCIIYLPENTKIAHIEETYEKIMF